MNEAGARDGESPHVSSCSLPPAVAGPLFGELDVEVLGVAWDTANGPAPSDACTLRVHWWGEPPTGGTLLATRYKRICIKSRKVHVY